MRILRCVSLVVALLLALAGTIVYFKLNGIVKTEVEKQASASLKLETTLSSARLSLLGGKVNLHELRIASPKGFSAPHMLELGNTHLAVSYRQLRKDPIHVESLKLDRPRLVIELSNGALNFKRAMDLMPPGDRSAEPTKLVIDDLEMKDALVVIHPGLPGMPAEITVPVPSITLKNVGRGKGAQNGAAIKDVAMAVITVLAARASESGALPAQMKALLHLNVGQVMGKLSDVVADPRALVSDPARALQQGLGGLLGGKTDDGAASKPSGRAGPRGR